MLPTVRAALISVCVMMPSRLVSTARIKAVTSALVALSCRLVRTCSAVMLPALLTASDKPDNKVLFCCNRLLRCNSTALMMPSLFVSEAAMAAAFCAPSVCAREAMTAPSAVIIAVVWLPMASSCSAVPLSSCATVRPEASTNPAATLPPESVTACTDSAALSEIMPVMRSRAPSCSRMRATSIVSARKVSANTSSMAVLTS